MSGSSDNGVEWEEVDNVFSPSTTYIYSVSNAEHRMTLYDDKMRTHHMKAK